MSRHTSGLCPHHESSRTHELLEILSGQLRASFGEGVKQAPHVCPHVISHNDPPQMVDWLVVKINSADNGGVAQVVTASGLSGSGEDLGDGIGGDRCAILLPDLGSQLCSRQPVPLIPKDLFDGLADLSR
jgi:hypothetical protein